MADEMSTWRARLAVDAAEAVAARESRKARTRKAALRLVTEGAIEWRANLGVDGGYVHVPSTPTGDHKVPTFELLIALWELRHHHLIAVDGHRVCVTSAAADLVSGWDGQLLSTDRLRSERVGSGGRG